MQSLLQITLILISLQTILFTITKCQTISISTKQTRDNYLYTQSVGWGTPTQKLNLLIDTTDHTSWVYNGSVNTNSAKFNIGSSSTFIPDPDKTTIRYIYQGSTMENVYIDNTDTITIGDRSLVKQSLGIATNRFNLTDDEGLSGFLALDRSNTIISGLWHNKSIYNQSVTIDVPNNKMYFGPHTPSSIANQSNSTECPTTGNQYLDADWTFNADISVDGGIIGTLGKTKAVIDAASPYISIYTSTPAAFETFWLSVVKNDENCNITTQYCSNTDIMNTMTINIGESPKYLYTVTITRDDILNDKNILIYYDGDTDFTSDCTNEDCDYVLFLGRPFLTHTVVTMDYGASPQTLTFYGLKETTSSLNWTTIGIVFGSVAAFAILFFGLYYWKYGRIPPPSNNDVEEQSLLRGPVQAVGSGQGVNQGAMYQGMDMRASGGGGLDDDEDEFNRQLQQAQRQSQIEAQQSRERQAREERERREREEMEEQAMLQEAQSRNQQQAMSGGGRLGGSAAKPQDKDDLRARRLKFLEDQEKKAQQNDDQ